MTTMNVNPQDKIHQMDLCMAMFVPTWMPLRNKDLTLDLSLLRIQRLHWLDWNICVITLSFHVQGVDP